MPLAHQACSDIACNWSHGSAGRIFASGKVRWTHCPMDPLMDGDVLGQYLAVDHERRHLVLRVDLQVLGREILPLAEIERPDIEVGARFGQRDIGRERAGVGGVVKSEFHSRLLIRLIDQLRI